MDHSTRSNAAGALPAHGHTYRPASAQQSATSPFSRHFAQPPKRLKLWELKDKYHCPIIDTCLSAEELAKFARRFNFGVPPRDKFLTHIEAVSRAGTRNEVSDALQKYLDNKYQTSVDRFGQAATPAEVLALWQAHLARNEAEGALWAAFTHPAASHETRQTVYADTRLLAQRMGTKQMQDACRLAHLKRKNADMQAALERERRERIDARADFRKRLHLLTLERDALSAQAAEIGVLRQRLAAFESGAAIKDMGRQLANLTVINEQMRTAARRSEALEQALRVARERSAQLSRRCGELVAGRDALERLLLAGDVTADQCGGDCTACDQATRRRCVLYVGGRTGPTFQYRALAARLGIRLIHYDGSRQEVLARLPDMINGADAVICPADCVSPSACCQLQHHCRRTGKPCLMLEEAGLPGFAAALARLSAGRIDPSANPDALSMRP